MALTERQNSTVGLGRASATAAIQRLADSVQDGSELAIASFPARGDQNNGGLSAEAR